MANESIPLFHEGPVTVLTDQAVVGKTFVAPHATTDATTGLFVVRTATANGPIMGVAAADIANAAQGLVHTQPGTILPVTADGSGVTVGDQICVGTAGTAKTFARSNSGSAAFNDTSPYAVGIAMNTAAAGDDVYVKLY